MPDTADLRNKARRVKSHILNKYLKVADKIDEDKPISAYEKQTYSELTPIFAKNVIPRSQEITGEDGESIKLDVSRKEQIESAINQVL